MSTPLRVPKRRAEQPNAKQLFPAGEWLMELEEVRVKDAADFMYEVSANAKPGSPPRALSNASQLGLQFGSAEALGEEQDEAGNQKLFLDIFLTDNGVDIDQVTDAAETGWGIKKDTAIFVNLAIALGQAYEEDGYYIPADGFLQALLAGEFRGNKVAVTVSHSPWKSKTSNKSGVNVNIDTFAPAA